ncbi:MAG: prolipoprotein diacylglyceryl transferase [Chloroflexi bacterium]|nr:prolipoprotein diacylglyceryl transferase [Chloroflexota bacterium]
MSGITININPTIFHAGPFSLRWYSVFVMLAIIGGLWLGLKEGKRRGILQDHIMNAALWGIVGGIVGARLFHVIDKLDFYLQNPHLILSINQGGLAIWGGVAGGMVACLIYVKSKKIDVGTFLDIGTPALLVGQLIGRFACIVNGDAYGGLTSLPWGFIYVNPEAMIPPQYFGVPTHPYPVYEQLWNLATLAFIWRLRTRPQWKGALFPAYMGIYSTGRLLLTFFRQEDIIFMGFQQAQLLALAGIAASAIILLYMMSRRPKRAQASVNVDIRR